MITKEKLQVIKVHVEGEEYSQTRYIYSKDGVDVMGVLEKAFPSTGGQKTRGRKARKSVEK